MFSIVLTPWMSLNPWSLSMQITTPRRQRFVLEKGFDLVGVRVDGLVNGYMNRCDLAGGVCGEYMCSFSPEDDVVSDTASLTEVVNSLAINDRCFVTK